MAVNVEITPTITEINIEIGQGKFVPTTLLSDYGFVDNSTTWDLGITDAPSDGSQYVRLNGAWQVNSGGTEVNDLTLSVTWANVPNANITVGSVTQHEAALTITESQISDLSHFSPTTLLADYSFTDNSSNWNTAFGWGDHSSAGYLTSFTETNDLSAAVTWINIPDANVPQSAITQHVAAIDHDSLLNFAANEHFTEASISITESQVSDLGSYLENLSEDTTPSLGGELDCGAHSIGGTVQTATGDGTTTIDWGNGNMFDFQFGAFSETFTFTAPTKPGTFILKLVQDGTGSRTVTWPGTVKWIDGTAPTLTTTATTGTDIITFYYNGTSYFAVQALNFS